MPVKKNTVRTQERFTVVFRHRRWKTVFVMALALGSLFLVTAYFNPSLRAALPLYPQAQPYLRLVRYAPFSDGGVCPFRQRVQGMWRHIAISRRTVEIMTQSARLKTEEGGLELWRTPRGDLWVPQTNDLWSLAVVLAEQEHDMYGSPGELGVHSGDVVLDAGAHIGLFTRTALASGAKLVVAIEPTPESAECIRRNEAEGIRSGRVIVIEEGVSDTPASVVFVRDGDCSACNHEAEGRGDAKSTFTAKLTTIDELVERLGLERVNFIKLDIENAELKAIQGGRRTIAANRPRIAVAAENAQDRSVYAKQIIAELEALRADYEYGCGVCSIDKWRNIGVEILGFY
jgi:FkbM family methyltransferase